MRRMRREKRGKEEEGKGASQAFFFEEPSLIMVLKSALKASPPLCDPYLKVYEGDRFLEL